MRSGMCSEDLFEGWLSVPAMESLFAFESQPSQYDAYNTIAEPRFQTDVAIELMHPAGGVPDRLPVGSDSVGAADLASLPLPTPPQALPEAATSSSNGRKRRGHTKSRLGCIGCKKRKIKCQETWPSCANCIRRGCPCTYPVVFKHTLHERAAAELPNDPRPLIQLSDTPKPSTYNANDMQLFHHYLVAAHPSIPPEYTEAWIRDIPRLSHQYEYLMHGMLAMSGSHLDIFIDNIQGHRALVHRQKAIEGLEQAFSRWPPTPNEAHVMLATSYLLAFQSTFLPDGMLEHILCLRGASMLSKEIHANNMEGAFHIDPTRHFIKWFKWRPDKFPSFDQQLIRDGLLSLAAFAPLLTKLETSRVERALLENLADSLRPLLVPLDQMEMRNSFPSDQSSPISHIRALSKIWGDSMHLPTSNNAKDTPPTKEPNAHSSLPARFEDIKSWETITEVSSDHRPDLLRHFNALISGVAIMTTCPRETLVDLHSPTNTLGNIILAHFCCVRFVTLPLSAPEGTMQTPIKAMVEWCEKLIAVIEDDGEVQWTKYVEWPQKIMTTLRGMLNQKRSSTFGDLFEALVAQPGVFREGRLMEL